MEIKEMDNKDLLLNQPESFRLNNDTDEKMNKLLKKYPAVFESKSHLIRCAIIKLYNELESGR